MSVSECVVLLFVVVVYACMRASACPCACACAKPAFTHTAYTLSLALRALSLSIFRSLYLSCPFDRSLQHLRCSSPAAWCVFFFFVVAFVAFVHSLSVSRFAAGFYRATSMSMAMAMAIVVFAVLITNAKLYHRSCQ